MPKITGVLDDWITDQVVKTRYNYMITCSVEGQKISFFDKDPEALADMLRHYHRGDHVTVEYAQKGNYSNGLTMMISPRVKQAAIKAPPGTTDGVIEPPEAAGEGPSTVLKGNELTELTLVLEMLKMAQLKVAQSVAYVSALRDAVRANPIPWKQGA